ncbi:NAD-dependent epimerase/dehydratase family protein [Zhouia amylolytica]|uniref:Nucleoside-diphosphate-sugar epimerase n=1 Tax=Zhouia amylolytica AD3 TaxID=1286632 RepID=W2UKF3_9FLAO|nr:NAD-dependent epimerase/dehydratase family protein [Zhouia amylolytica]ETN93782.1 nucleoside-diphosphate-sugar epimerase [Zhouia amylolytica AD3]
MNLVTGATGLVGSFTTLGLLKKGEKVRALYRNKDKQLLTKKVFEMHNAIDLFDAIEWYQSDITDIPRLTNAFIGIDHVYHCAALISFNPGDRRKLKKSNIEGTANIVNLSIDHHIKKLCYVSSIATLGKPIKETAVTEKNHWNPEAPNNVYAVSKYRAEMEVWRGSQEDLDVIVVNPGVILGPEHFESGSGAFYKILRKGVSFYPQGGTGFIDVEDVAKYMIALMHSNIKNERYILVSENTTYKEVIDRIANKTKTKPPHKPLKNWILKVLWRLDWLKAVFGGKRKLTKNTAHSLNSSTYYSSEKLRETLSKIG